MNTEKCARIVALGRLNWLSVEKRLTKTYLILKPTTTQGRGQAEGRGQA